MLLWVIRIEVWELQFEFYFRNKIIKLAKMVSTRQMSSVGGGSGGGDVAGPSNSEPTAVPRVTRHSSALLPGGSSPHASTSKCVSLLPAPKSYTTNILDLPEEVIEKIFSYIGFKSVSQLRMVTIFLYSRHYHCTNRYRSGHGLIVLTLNVQN